MSNELVTWLNGELNKRGWSNSELHRRSGLATSTISMVLGHQYNPGWEFCAKVAQALGEPPSKLFRLAGLLPQLPTPEDELIQEIDSLARGMPQNKREILVLFARFLCRTNI